MLPFLGLGLWNGLLTLFNCVYLFAWIHCWITLFACTCSMIWVNSALTIRFWLIMAIHLLTQVLQKSYDELFCSLIADLVYFVWFLLFWFSTDSTYWKARRCFARLCHFSSAMACCRAHISTSVLPSQLHEWIYGPHLRWLWGSFQILSPRFYSSFTLLQWGDWKILYFQLIL